MKTKKLNLNNRNMRMEHFSHIKQKNTALAAAEIRPEDKKLLDFLIDKYNYLGRSPTTAEVPQATMIKARFGLWKTALAAAGLPPLNDPEQQRLRNEERLDCKKTSLPKEDDYWHYSVK